MSKPAPTGAPPDAHPRSRAGLLALALLALVLFAGFVALGTWQVQRLHWKRDLITRVEQRVHAAPVAPPGPQQWAQVSAAADEYRRVSISGHLLPEFITLVQAATELGSGYWVLTPLRAADGSIVFVNRGFVGGERVPQGTREALSQASAAKPETVTVVGLLRLSEPGGAFLRHNDPAANRWYSRDVQAIAAARGLAGVAPYFIDADAASAAASTAAGHEAPVGGLTVIAFSNNHLVYALTWYALALMVAGAAWWIGRESRTRALRHD